MSRWLSGSIPLAILFGLIATARSETPKAGANAQPPATTEPARVDQAALDKSFAEQLTGAVFAGSYSVTTGGKEQAAQMEKYTIARVSKLKDDYWLFSARIQYGKTDITVPMSLQVKWAGDTPVITLTNLTIPGLGTFTSRVLIHGDRYAGTWQHDKTGGHLWGRIERPEPDADGKKDSAKSEKTDALPEKAP
jgi:hypothetical protein